MNHLRVPGCVAVLVALGAFLASTEAPADRRVETLWRGAIGVDSVFVRATWIPTSGSTSCYGSQTSDDDSNEPRRKYVEYRIEGLRGNVRDRGVLSEPESLQFCCDGLYAEVARWSSGLVVKLTAYGCCCEPSGACSDWRYVHVAGADSVAASEWTDISWDPTTGNFTDAWVTENCFQYPMRLTARVQGSILAFVPTFLPGVKEGDLIEKEIDRSEAFMDCLEPFSPKQPTSVAWYRGPDSKAPEQLLIRSSDSVEIVSAVIRAERSEAGELAPRIVRVGVQVSGRRGFLTRADLKALGFLGL